MKRSEGTRNRVVLIRRQQQVLRDVDIDPVACADGDGGWDIDEAVEHMRAGPRKARSDTGFIGFASRFVVALISVRGLGCARDNAQRNRSSEYLDIVVVDLVLEAGGSGLIETVELVEIDGVAVWHQQTVKGDGEALLAEAGNLLHLAEDESAFGDQQVLPVLTVDGVGDHYLQRPGELTIKTVDQYRVDSRALKDDIGLAVCGVDVHLRRTLVGGRRSGLCWGHRWQARRVSR